MFYKDKVVWVTGASSGIGKALAMTLSQKEALLILSARNINALEEVKGLCKYPERVMILPLDLSNYNAFDKLVEEAIQLFGRVDVLVNNGGISQRSLSYDTSIEVDKKLFEINYFGTVALTKAMLPYFMEKRKGHIVATSSIVGKLGTPLRSSYSASKHALHGFYDSLRAEVYAWNIDVTIVCPGFVTTNISKNALTGDGSELNSMDKATANGIKPERFAVLMAKAIAKKKKEVYIAGAKEKLGVYARRWVPALYYKLVRKLAVT